MPLGQRTLQVTIAMPSGDVILDESLDLRVRIHKDALALQNSCDIEVTNLSASLRTALLSQFTAWNKRNIETGQPGYQASYINVTVKAGYRDANRNTSTNVFVGQIVGVDPSSPPPNIRLIIHCLSQQLNKLGWISGQTPIQTTFKEYVQWAGAQMGVSNVICETSYDQKIITNPSASTAHISALLVDIQSAYRPNVAAFIDNNILIVKDINKVVSTSQIVTVNEFIGTPLWTEWGVTFESLFDPNIQLAGAATLESLMNPSLNKTFVISSLDYDLTSRDVPFYVKVFANPSA